MSKKYGFRNLNALLLSLLLAAGCGGGSTGEVSAVETPGETAASEQVSGKEEQPAVPTVDYITVTEFTGEEEVDDIEIEHIAGSTYEGWIMFVHNPEDISVEVNPYLGSYADAPSLDGYIEVYNAVAGINAGGFEDIGGNGNGSIPQGIVIHNGELLYGDLSHYSEIIGIDKDNRLICAGCTAQQALDWGIQEAVTFGPVLISDYVDVFDRNYTNLQVLNPRTAIGQMTDGTFMLVVLDGRGPSAFGAKYEDVVELFKQYDTVNAANLDGGNSTAMIYEGEYVNNTVSMYGSRNLPTVFLVKEGEAD